MQFGFDLRKNREKANSFKFGTTTFSLGTTSSYFLPNCKCILLPFTATMASQPSGGATLSAKIENIFHNQYYMLTTE